MESKTSYEKIAESYFDSVESELAPIKTKRRIFLMLSLLFLLAGLALLVVSNSTNNEMILGIGFLITVLAIVLGFISRKFKKELKFVLKRAKNSFYDEVFFEVVKAELQATGSSKTNEGFGKAEVFPGQILYSRWINLQGKYNGVPYKLYKERTTVVSQTTTTQSGKVVDYQTETIDSDVSVQYLGKNRTDSKIKLHKLLFNEKGILKRASKLLNKMSGEYEVPKEEGLVRIKMDRQDFDYLVYSEDELTAYKALTPDVLESITAYGKIHRIKDMELNRNVINIDLSYSDLNLNPRYKFYSKMAKNKELYTDDCLKSITADTVNAIIKLIEGLPLSNFQTIR